MRVHDHKTQPASLPATDQAPTVNEWALKLLQRHVIKNISAYRVQNRLMQYRPMEMSSEKNQKKSDSLQQIKSKVSFIFNRIEINFR